jgi:hypothetical protein
MGRGDRFALAGDTYPVTRRQEAIAGALELVRTLSIAATRREHAECDGKRRCMYCVDQETYPELEEAGIQPWPKENPAPR